MVCCVRSDTRIQSRDFEDRGPIVAINDALSAIDVSSDAKELAKIVRGLPGA